MNARIFGRYALFDEIARGGMASIHLARFMAAVGFARTVVVKRMRPELALDPQFCAMFVDEARIAARVRHPNVAQTLDVISEGGELLLVLDYIAGVSLAAALSATFGKRDVVPVAVANAIFIDTLRGLHAAHTAVDERGEPLQIVHRDVSPQNVLIGEDGASRLIDFGVAKAVGRLQSTVGTGLRGKLAYMAPEQIEGTVTHRTDIYAAGVVLWETLVGKRFLRAENEGALILEIMRGHVPRPPSELRPGVTRDLDALVLRAVHRDSDKRWSSADEMARALEQIGPVP